jgi:hypothetical protein
MAKATIRIETTSGRLFDAVFDREEGDDGEAVVATAWSRIERQRPIHGGFVGQARSRWAIFNPDRVEFVSALQDDED